MICKILTFTVCGILRSPEKQMHAVYYGNNCFNISNVIHLPTMATISISFCYDLIVENTISTPI